MAAPGYHKNLKSTNSDLEVKRSGKTHYCAGVAFERGARPGTLQDVWMWSRSKRCQDVIRQGQFYVANKKLPPRVKNHLKSYDYGGWLPLCLPCAMDSYSEFFEGPDKTKFMRPLTPEQRQNVIDGLLSIIEEAA